jgi:ketosteroid isomerase-like protein
MEESYELKDLTLRLFKALESGDISFFERMFPRQGDVVVIGTDPDEWWADYPTIIQVFKAQLEEMKGFKFVASDPQAYSDHNVGWSIDRLRLRSPDGGEIPIRMTNVFHKYNGQWKIVHTHLSMGVPNEEALGQKLTV